MLKRFLRQRHLTHCPLIHENRLAGHFICNIRIGVNALKTVQITIILDEDLMFDL